MSLVLESLSCNRAVTFHHLMSQDEGSKPGMHPLTLYSFSLRNSGRAERSKTRRGSAAALSIDRLEIYIGKNHHVTILCGGNIQSESFGEKMNMLFLGMNS